MFTFTFFAIQHKSNAKIFYFVIVLGEVSRNLWWTENKKKKKKKRSLNGIERIHIEWWKMMLFFYFPYFFSEEKNLFFVRRHAFIIIKAKWMYTNSWNIYHIYMYVYRYFQPTHSWYTHTYATVDWWNHRPNVARLSNTIQSGISRWRKCTHLPMYHAVVTC